MGFFDNAIKWVGHEADNISDDFKYGVNTVGGVVKNTENSFSDIVSMPLIILSVGVAFFLYKSDAGQVADAAKNIAPLAMG